MAPITAQKARIHPSIASLAADITTLTPDPRNARSHSERNLREIVESYRDHGQLKPIVVQRVADDGTPMVVRAGNGQLAAAKQLGWDAIAVVVVDMNDVDAIKYALRDNRTAELAQWNPEELSWSLDYLNAHATTASSVGWEPYEVDQLRPGESVDPESEWDGMPEFEHEDQTAQRKIVMNFKSQADAEAFGRLIGQNVTDKTRSLWHPKAEQESLVNKRYAPGDAGKETK